MEKLEPAYDGGKLRSRELFESSVLETMVGRVVDIFASSFADSYFEHNDVLPPSSLTTTRAETLLEGATFYTAEFSGPPSAAPCHSHQECFTRTGRFSTITLVYRNRSWYIHTISCTENSVENPIDPSEQEEIDAFIHALFRVSSPSVVSSSTVLITQPRILSIHSSV